MRGGLTPELNREAKRLVREMPKWSPGEVKGKPVRARCRLPITFTLAG
jgi:protein TonB